MEKQEKVLSTDELAFEVTGGVFFIEPDSNRLLKDCESLFSAGMSFNKFDYEEIKKIKSEKTPCVAKTYIEFARVPLNINVEDVHKNFLGNPEQLILNPHEIIAFCEKYKEWFKNHIRVGYFFTTKGFAIVRDPYRTGELNIGFFKINALHDFGVGLKNSLAFIIKIDWGKFVPH